jgi:hypothetical protein
MPNSHVPFLSVGGFRRKVQRIVDKDLLDFRSGGLMARDVSDVGIVPLEYQFIRHLSQVYIRCMYASAVLRSERIRREWPWAK